MVRALIFVASFWLGSLSALAQTGQSQERVSFENCDNVCLFETIWSNAERLDPSKRERLASIFLKAVMLTGDGELLSSWESRIGAAYQPDEIYEDYALKKVSRFVVAEGWDAFFSHAQSRAYPFNSGRPEMMAAAAEHIADDDIAERIYRMMERLGSEDRSRAAFERASFGHALAEAAMRRCDVAGFDRALELTDAPDSLRYAFWRTRMHKEAPGSLQARIDREFDPKNSAILRQAIDGFADVLKLGPCTGTAR